MAATDRPSGAVASRLVAALSAPAGVDVLERLRAEGLVDARADPPARDVTDELVNARTTEGGTRLDAPTAIGRIDPRQSRLVLADGRILGMYVAQCYINTEAEPAYHRMSSSPNDFPYHIVYLLGFPPGEAHTVLVTLQVFSAGTVSITGTGVTAPMTLGQSSVPLTVPVGLTTSTEGFASISIQRTGQSGFDWFSAEVL